MFSGQPFCDSHLVIVNIQIIGRREDCDKRRETSCLALPVHAITEKKPIKKFRIALKTLEIYSDNVNL